MALAQTSKIAVILLIIAAVALTGFSVALITSNQSVPSSGTITAGPNVAIYSNSGCTNVVSSINWGSVEAGSSTQQTIYIENTGGSQMAPSITVSNWSPTNAGTCITIAWSTLPAEIEPGISNAAAITLTLTVSSNATGITNFSNEITITGTS